MGSGWVAAVDEAEIAPDADGLAEAIAAWGRFTAKLAAAVGTFDVDGGWAADDGATPNAVAWLRSHGVDRGDAVRLVRTGRLMRVCPELEEMATSGALTSGQVRAITAPLKGRHVNRFSEMAPDVLPRFAGLSTEDTTVAMRRWIERADAEDDGPEPRPAADEVHLSQTLDDRFVLNGSLDAMAGSTLGEALRLADSKNLDEPAAQRRADALYTIARFFLDNQQTHTGGRHRPHVNVTVDFESWHNGTPEGYFTETGIRVRPDALAALLCDCALHRVVTKGRSAVLDYGTATRDIPCTLWNALVLRDRHCRFEDCDRPASWCDGHHVIEVERFGPTNLENLVLLCGYHHRLIHKRRWKVELLPGAVLVVTTDTGRAYRTRPPPDPADLLPPEPALAT